LDAQPRRLEPKRAQPFARWHFLSGDAEGKVNQFHLQASFVKRTAHFPWHARNAL